MKLYSLFIFILYLCQLNATLTDSEEEAEFDAQAARNAYISSFDISPHSICHVVDTMLDLKYQSVNVSLAGILGRSYDLLTDKSFYPILQESFTSCQKTPDSRFYIPNNYRVMFLMDRHIDMSAQLSSSFKDATESTTAGGTVSGSGSGKKFAGSGTGSANYQHTKKKMEQEGNSMYHMSVINNMYRLTGDMSAKFTKAFEYRIRAIIEALQQDNPLKARYLVERVISDFGTHVTMDALVGTRLEYRAYVKQSAVSTDKSTRTTASAQATAELKKTQGGGVGTFTNNEIDRSADQSFSMSIEAYAMGGAELKKLNKPNEAADDTYPVALARSVYPIYIMMDSGNLDHIINKDDDNDIEAQLRQHFEAATHEYFERNQINGCMDKDKMNYDFQANVDDGTCSSTPFCKLVNVEGSSTLQAEEEKSGCETLNDKPKKFSKAFLNYFRKDRKFQIMECNESDDREHPTLGGVFQICEPYPESKQYNSEWKKIKDSWKDIENRIDPCERLGQQSFNRKSSCPADTIQTEIISFEHTLPDIHIANETLHCFNGTSNCTDIRTDIVFRDRVHLTSYWCGVKNGNGYASLGFGGFYDHGQVNKMNGQRDCSATMQKVTLFHGTTFCLTTPMFMNTSYLTYIYNNRDKTVNCPHGHSKQLITVINFEKIYACILKEHYHYKLSTPVINRGPYLDKRFGRELYDQGYFTIKHNGKVVERSLLSEIGHKIYGYHSRHLELLKNQTVKEVKHGVVTDFFFKRYITIIIGAVLFVVCLLVLIFCCCC